MKHSRFILFVALILIPVSGFATQIIIGKGSRSQPINSTSFGILSPSGTSPGTSPCVFDGIKVSNCDFVNESGANWNTLSFAFDPVQSGDNFSCSGGPWYSNCNFLFNADGEATGVFFFNVPRVLHCDPATDEFCGIPTGSPGDFTFTVIGFTGPTDFDGQANSPEPATLGLFLLGLLGLGLYTYRCRRVRV